MNTVLPNLLPALPELWVLTMGCVILLIDVFQRRRVKTLTYVLVQLTLIVAAYLTYRQFGNPSVVTFNGLFILDNLAIVLKLVIYASSFITFIFARNYLKDTDIPYGEFYLLSLFSILGMMVLVSANNFLTLYLGLEILSLPIYALIALRVEQSRCAEAAIKYFIVGAIASGMLLYGLSMLYGATHTLTISTVAHNIASAGGSLDWILLFALVFTVVGIAFKLGMVPFHMWVPDVYQGAPSILVLLIGGAAKIAGFALMIRLLVDALPALHISMQSLLITLALLSMAVGNIAAVAQSSIKRMLGYSSIAHMGYMILGMVAGTSEGHAASLFYMITYAITTLGAFGTIVVMTRSGIESEAIDDFKGLSRRNPWLAFLMLLLMFSLAGVPPLVGFIAKVAVLQSLIDIGLVWLAVAAILFAIVGAYYYIRVIKVMYFDEPSITIPFTYTYDSKLAISVSGLSVFALGLFPNVLVELCQMVF